MTFGRPAAPRHLPSHQSPRNRQSRSQNRSLQQGVGNRIHGRDEFPQSQN